MFQINLIPEAKQVQKRAQKLNILSTTVAISIIVLFVVAALIFLGLFGAKKVKLGNLNSDIESVEEKLTEYEDLEKTVISLEKGLKNIEAILEGENKWSVFFDELELSTPSDIQFTSLNLSDSVIEASLIGKDVNSLARFVESFKTYKPEGKEDRLYRNVNVTGYSKDGDTVGFSAEFEIVKEVLWP